MADKTKALASYERARHKNEIAVRNLKHANNRIWQRMGELYKAEKKPGARADLAPQGRKVGAIAKGAEIGHSRKQVANAIQAADMAAGATKKTKPTYEPSDPRSPAWKAARKLLNAFEQFVDDMEKVNMKTAVAGIDADPDASKRLRAALVKLEKRAAAVRKAVKIGEQRSQGSH